MIGRRQTHASRTVHGMPEQKEAITGRERGYRTSDSETWRLRRQSEVHIDRTSGGPWVRRVRNCQRADWRCQELQDRQFRSLGGRSGDCRRQ